MQKRLMFPLKNFLFAGVFSVCEHIMYLSVPVYMMVAYDKILFSFSRATLYSLGTGLIISLAAVAVLGYLRHRILCQAGTQMVHEAETRVIESMFADRAGISSKDYTRGLADLEVVRSAVSQGYLHSFLDLPWIVVYLGILAVIHPLLGVIALTSVFLAGVLHLLLAVVEKKRDTEADVIYQANADYVKACLLNAQPVSAMKMLPALIRDYRRRQSEMFSIRSGAEVLYGGIGAVIRLIQLIGPAAVFGVGVFVFFNDEVSAGGILAGTAISFRLFFFFEKRLAEMLPSIAAAAARKRLEHLVDPPAATEKLSLPAPEGGLAVQGISLAVAGRTVLYNISFDLAPGEMLGIIGPSSAGKTCLCRVLLGVWAPTAGTIRLDGAEIRQWPEDDLGGYLGYLPQEPILTPTTVARNIARLREPESDKVVAAAEKAGIHDSVLTLPEGYDTMVADMGANLAAGLRQGICLARALYDDPKVVVLDEPHTYLDDRGLQGFVNGLAGLRQSRTTTVVVSDRPRILTHMDKLLMLKEGQPAMYGSAKEVLAQISNKQTPRQTTGV